MNVFFVPEAKEEFLDAISYYEDARAGLGLRFQLEVDRSIRWISEHYALYRLRPGGYRRFNLRIFPYHIAFVVVESTLWILAVAHSSRKPEHWIKRHGNE
jgi:plasmid stabilization system protein ParE